MATIYSADGKALGLLVDSWAAVRGLHHLYWTMHWLAQGNPAYGDHLLYERLYKARVDEIDGIAEQLVLIGGPRMVSPGDSWTEAGEFLAKALDGPAGEAPSKTLVSATMLALRTVVATEKAFRNSEDVNALGVNNLLAGIAQSLNEALYLLRQRSAA